MLEVIVYKRLKTVGSYYNDSPKKRGVIAYSRWSYRGSKCKVLTGKNFVLWIGGRLQEVGGKSSYLSNHMVLRHRKV